MYFLFGMARMGHYEKYVLGRLPMQNRSDFGTPRFSTPQTNMEFPHDDIAIVHKYTK